MAMNPEVKAEWVKALRSGEYKQTMSTLHRMADNEFNEPEGYCCLGVLCELAVKAGACPAPVPFGSRFEYDGHDIDLPESVQEWAGLIDKPSQGESVVNDLIGYNDGGKDFAYIADVIEARL